MKEKILKAYCNGSLTIQEYRVLLGLINSGDETGAIKGYEKLIRRKKRNERTVRDVR